MKLAAQLDAFTAPARPLPAVDNPASHAAAAAVKPSTTIQRRRDVLNAITSVWPNGLARFQVAEMLGVPQHWITSSVDALKATNPPTIMELTGSRVQNPASGKWCTVLVATIGRRRPLEEPS